MRKDDAVFKRRALASRRLQACAAGLCAGANVFLLGAGLAAAVCANGAWIAGFAAVPACATAAALCRGRAARGGLTRSGAAFLAAAWLAHAVFACAALVALAEQSLLPQARALHIAVLTAVFAVLCAAAGAGVFRVCFLLRAALPLVLIVCAAVSLEDGSLAGVFPLLGAGAGRIGLSALLLPAGSFAPVLLILLPPPELENAGDAPIPGAGFYAGRMALGAAAGCALLFLFCGGATPQALAGAGGWGERLALIAGAGAHQGLADTALLLALCAAAALTAGCMLAACAQAVQYAFPRAGERAALCALFLLLVFSLAALTAYGMDAALLLAPAAAVPALAALLKGGRKRNQKGGDAA